jgi:hypothetical protein
MQITNNYVVITVSTILKREKLIKKIYEQLTAEPTNTFTIQQDQVNRIKVFHNTKDGVRVLVRTYIVIVIPIIIDLAPLHSIYGNVDFCLDDTIESLTSIISKLQKLKGHKIIRGNSDGKALERELARLIR